MGSDKHASRTRLHAWVAVAATAAVVSCVAHAASLVVEHPERFSSPHEATAAAAINWVAPEGKAEAPPHEEARPPVLADATDRPNPRPEAPTASCPVVVPQFEALPQMPREFGDYPRMPFA